MTPEGDWKLHEGQPQPVRTSPPRPRQTNLEYLRERYRNRKPIPWQSVRLFGGGAIALLTFWCARRSWGERHFFEALLQNMLAEIIYVTQVLGSFVIAVFIGRIIWSVIADTPPGWSWKYGTRRQRMRFSTGTLAGWIAFLLTLHLIGRATFALIHEIPGVGWRVERLHAESAKARELDRY